MKDSSHNPGIEKIKQQLSEGAELPRDVVLGVPIVTVTGQQEALIENHRGIIEYTDTLIRIQTKNNQLKVTGSRLNIVYYTNEELLVTGVIGKIEYVK